jgi:hypothetical protein
MYNFELFDPEYSAHTLLLEAQVVRIITPSYRCLFYTSHEIT